MSRVAEIFDEWARNGRAEGMERGHSPAARMAFDRLRLGPEARFLDIGCGNGYAVRWAAAAAPRGHAVGIDISPEMIAQARLLSAGIGNAEFAVRSFPDQDPPGGPFDAIFSMEAFYYLPDPSAAIRRARDLLRPGGTFACVMDFYGENAASHSWPADLGVSMTLLDAAGWADLFRRAGLAVADQRRLRVPRAAANAEWKTTVGSLLTLGRK